MKSLSFSKINFLLAVSLLTFTTACKKLIEIPAPNNKITTNQIFADSADVMGAVAGIYSNYGESYNSYSTQVFMNGLITEITGLSSDELTLNSSDPNLVTIQRNAILANNTVMAACWSNAYKSLYQINACLDGISSSTGISASLKQQLTGEIKVNRAFYYFNLVNLFGGVPLVTSTDYHITSTLPKASTEAIYTQIITDLTDAQKTLSANYPSDGRARPNVYTATALLAKVYLYQSQWQKAYDMANQVIASGTYQLEPNLNNVFLDGSVEAIWQLPANGSNNQTPEASLFVPAGNFEAPQFSLNNTLLNAFESGDQRQINWIDSIMVNVNGINQTYYYPFKYKNTFQSTATTTEDYMMLRLGEQYLIRAEANAELNKLPDALTDLNLIRNRAGLPNSTAITQSGIIKAIMHERQTELFCEWGNRWYDLKRTLTINSVLNSEKTGWQPNDALYPIPQLEILANPNLKQNQGY